MGSRTISKYKFIFILTLFCCSNYFSQKSKCQNIILSYNDSCYKSPAECFKGKFDRETLVSFDQGIKDTIKVLFNSKVVYRKFIDSETPEQYRDLRIDYKKNRRKNNVIVIVVEKKCKLKINLDPKYYLISISHSANKWFVSYSNQADTYE